MLREVGEEMGCGLENIQRIGEAVQFFRADDGEYEMYAVFFTGELQGEVNPTAEELSWRSLQELEKDMYHECHLWAVRTVLGAEKKRDERS